MKSVKCYCGIDIPYDGFCGISSTYYFECSDDWSGHQTAVLIGKQSGEHMESYLKDDEDVSSLSCLMENYKDLIKIKKDDEIYIYVPYRVVGHISDIPTFDFDYVKRKPDMMYEVTVELMFVAGDTNVRYVEYSYITEGENAKNLYSMITDMNKVISDLFQDQKSGFWVENGKYYVKFYDQLGQERTINLPYISELQYVLTSVRIIDIQVSQKKKKGFFSKTLKSVVSQLF